MSTSGKIDGSNFRHRNRLEKFRRAGIGVGCALRGRSRWLDSSWKIHLPAAVLVVFAGLYWQIERWEWTVLVLAIGFVFVAEFWNTAFEFLSRSITQDFDSNIQNCLDIAAGGVLISSCVAVVTGALIFMPRIVTW